MFSFTPPTDPLAYPAWLAWLDANRLTPLAYRELADQPLPPGIRTHLAAAYAESTASWLQRKSETATLLAILAEEPAIPVILLKGIALALSLYPDPALRPMNDLDLLIAPSDFDRMVDRLLQRGYQTQIVELAPGFGDIHLHHFGVTSPNTSPPLRIELHHTLPRLSVQNTLSANEWFWQNSEPLLLWKGCAQVFNPTAQLLHSSAHLMQQHGEQQAILIWIYDIDLLWRKRGNDIDCAELVQKAHRLGWEAALHATLINTAATFNTPFPGEVRDWLKQDPSRLSGYTSVSRLAEKDRTRAISVFEAIRTKSFRGKLHFVARMIAPDTKYMRYRYKPAHPLLLPLTYPYRWLDIAGDLARTGYRALRRRIRTSLSQH